MIFVTVGTHEQQFNRLVQAIDALKRDGKITEDVVIQTGYSTYEPQHCQWDRFYSYDQMLEYTKEARIVVCHGGPSSFIMPLQIGKIPVVVPRQKVFDEHINNHQLDFCRTIDERRGMILLVEEIDDLFDYILQYDEKVSAITAGLNNNNAVFCEKLEKILLELL